MQQKRFFDSLEETELALITRIFQNYRSDKATPVAAGDEIEIASILEKSERLLPESRFQKIMFAIVRLFRKQSGVLVFTASRLDVATRLYVSAEVRNFIADVEKKILAEKYPFLTPARFAALKTRYPLDALLLSANHKSVLAELAQSQTT